MNSNTQETFTEALSQQRDMHIQLIESLAKEHSDDIATFYVLQDLVDQIKDLEDEE